MSAPKRHTSKAFFALALITLTLSSWGLFRLFVDFAHAPVFAALIVVAGLDLAAIAFGQHALRVAADGDSSAPWNAGLYLFTALASYVQFAHIQLTGQPLVIGIVMAALPVVTVALFEGQLRRAYRLNGRAAGRLDPPRATQPLAIWLANARLAARATRMAALDAGLDQGSALVLAERALELDEAAAAVPTPERPRIRRTYAHLMSGDALTVAAGMPLARPESDAEPVPGATGTDAPASLAALVRAAHADAGTELADVLSHVRTVRPDARERDVQREHYRQLARSNGSG